MMTIEELRKFCDPRRDDMCAPFSLGEFSYATNGHIMIRVPRMADVTEWEAMNERATSLFDLVDYDAANAALVEIPEFTEPDPKACTCCKGTGKLSKCPECDGDGEVTLENVYNEYECTCKTCDGDGFVSGHESICEECGGTGKKKVIKRIEVGKSGFSSHYLTILKAMPGMKIAPTSKSAACYFKWDEGDGVLMPMRA